MKHTIEKTIESLANLIEKIIESGSDEERQLLPELVNSLANLISLSSQHSDLYLPELLCEDS